MQFKPTCARCSKCGRAYSIPALTSSEAIEEASTRPRQAAPILMGLVKLIPYVGVACIGAWLFWGQNNQKPAAVAQAAPTPPTQTYTASYRPQPSPVAPKAEDTSETVNRVAETTGRVLYTAGKAIEVYQKVRGSSEESPSYDLIIDSASIASLKANGKRWDADDSAPDVEVHVSKKGSWGSTFETRKVQDDFSPSFREKAFRVSAGDTLVIKVVDKDLFADDAIGEYEKAVTAETLRQGSASWSFRQVNSLRVRFEP